MHTKQDWKWSAVRKRVAKGNEKDREGQGEEEVRERERENESLGATNYSQLRREGREGEGRQDIGGGGGGGHTTIKDQQKQSCLKGLTRFKSLTAVCVNRMHVNA